MSIGRKIEELRKKIGITQIQLADYLGVDQSFISQVESGIRTLSIEMATKLTNLAGIGPDYFFDDFNCFDCPTIQIDFRPSNMTKADLESIAEINVIANNIKWMTEASTLLKKVK